MERRLWVAAAFFAAAIVMTGSFGRWLRPALVGPASALLLAALGVLLIGLAPPPPTRRTRRRGAAPQPAAAAEERKVELDRAP